MSTFQRNTNMFDPLGGQVPYELDDMPMQWDFSELEEYSYQPETIIGDTQLAFTVGEKAGGRLKEIDETPSPPSNREARGMEVGDDRVDKSSDATLLALGLCVQQEVVGMVTSEKDTFISGRLWNFTEVTSRIPTTKLGSFDMARKTGNFTNLEFVDTIILRIIIDCSKSDRSHSSTAVGKAGMLGSRLNTPRSEFREIMHLASFIQDACLRTSMSPDPKYLPSIMGGSGVRALFDDPDNLYLSVKAYRGGGYDRLYGTATQELIECLRMNEHGTGANPVLCSKLRDRQDYLHGTYDAKVFIPQGFGVSGPGEKLPTPLYIATGGQNRFQATENRLIRTRHLIGRRDAERELEQTFRTRNALFGRYSVEYCELERKMQSARSRERFGRALQANSAFQNLLRRKASPKDVQELTNSGMLSVNTGVSEFRKLDSLWLFEGGKSETLTIENLTTTEDIYFRQEVSTEESFRVGGIELRPIVGNKLKLVTTRHKAGLYEINQSMEEWAERICARLHAVDGDRPVQRDTILDIYANDTEWVQDDSLIIAKCLKDTQTLTGSRTVMLISDDRRLGNQLANTCNITVIRLSAKSVVNILQIQWSVETQLDLDQMWAYCSRGRNVTKPLFLYIDRGSVAAACTKKDFEQVGGHTQLVEKTLLETGHVDNKTRFSREAWVLVPQPAYVRQELHIPVIKPRRFRAHRALSDTYQESRFSGSWRSASGSVSSRGSLPSSYRVQR